MLPRSNRQRLLTGLRGEYLIARRLAKNGDSALDIRIAVHH